ncbi:MAG: hypothetical protein IPQ10_02505 [Saprospiraceae bacterium]|jgi:hypothetical protein|nr:hypothetical protein [Saprospiraceae bacterium]
MKKLIILPFLLINIIQIESFAECQSPIKDTILTINAINQILGYSPKDIIWHIKERIYQNKITVPNKIYSADQRQKLKYLRKELKKKGFKIIETVDTIELWKVFILDSSRFINQSKISKKINRNNGSFDAEPQIDSNTYSQQIIKFSKSSIFLIDYDFPNPQNTTYDITEWYPKSKFPIEVNYNGILNSMGFQFQFTIPIFFHNNYPAMLQFYHSYYGLWIDRSFERRKRIHVFQRN